MFQFKTEDRTNQVWRFATGGIVSVADADLSTDTDKAYIFTISFADGRKASAVYDTSEERDTKVSAALKQLGIPDVLKDNPSVLV